MSMKRIVIIGGGITGLAVAHRLVELRREIAEEFEITLLEGGSKLAGVIQTELRDGFLLERGPDSFVSEKPEAIDLTKRLGLESQLIETNQEHRRSFVVRGGRLRPVPEGFHLLAPARLWPFVTSDIFSWKGKARIAMDLLLPKTSMNGDDDESLASFVRRRLGQEALERMAQPMAGGIYTADPEKLSLRATMPRFLEIERQHRSVILGLMRRVWTQKEGEARGTSGARYSLFLSFDLGMQTLVRALSTSLSQEQLRLDSRVESLRWVQSAGAWAIENASGESFRADAVCIALPAHAAAQLLRETDARLADELGAIPYASTATVNLAYNRDDISHPLNGFGFVVPFAEKRSIIACSFSSVKFVGRAPKGQTLLRAFVGGALQAEILQLDEAELIERVQADLRDLLGISGLPLFTEVTRWVRSMPQYEVGHLDRVNRIDNHLLQIPTLKLAGNAYGGAGIGDCVRSGETSGDELAALIKTLDAPALD